VLDSDSLPLPQRLALAYAPSRLRDRWRTLLAFDHQLAQTVAQAREPLLKQMRLAWWRDTLASPASRDLRRTELVRDFADDLEVLGASVDGWEELTAPPPLSADALVRYASGRAGPFLALAAAGRTSASDGVRAAAMLWALGDFAAHASDPDERRLAAECAGASPGRLPREMRPLAVLAVLAHRALVRGTGGLMDDRSAALLAMRVGILGR